MATARCARRPVPPRSRPTRRPSQRPLRLARRARHRCGAVAKPNSGDAAEDGYLYGYRLWQAKLYPEAETALKEVVAKYPSHKRWSFAQNLLGRSYLDEGKPSLASIAFYDNYKKAPEGERAPDSLFYLAQALVKLGKPADACKVWGELTESYPDKDLRRNEGGHLHRPGGGEVQVTASHDLLSR